MASELHIIVPGLCGPLAETQSIKDDPELKDWVKLLSKSRCSTLSASADEVISSVFKFSIDGNLPSAALTLLANDLYDESLYYMHADPVHLRAELDHAVLTPSNDLAIEEDESRELCNALDQHFSQDGLAFIPLNKDQWCVSSKKKINLQTTPLVDAVGRNVNFILPTGKDSLRWKQLLTEAQMLMHAHSVNHKREKTGQPCINSVWFYGPGTLPVADTKISSVCSNDDLYKGITRLLKCSYSTVPSTVSMYQDMLSNNNTDAIHVLHLSELESLTSYTDVSMWLEKLHGVLNDWIYPMIKFSNKNNIKITLYPCNDKYYQFEKFDSLKFWRHGKVEQYVTRY